MLGNIEKASKLRIIIINLIFLIFLKYDIIVFVFESLSHEEEMDEARILYVVF